MLRAPDVTLDLAVDVGLTTAEAVRRLEVDGPNELRGAPPVPTWRRALGQLRDPLIYLLLGAVAVSLVAWLLEGRVGLPVDVLVISVVILFNAVLGFAQEARARNAVAALQEMTAVSSTVVRDGVAVRLPSSQLVRGDLLVLSEGDAVGADAVLTYAAALRLQESSLTGESGAVDKEVVAGVEPGLDQPGRVFKGTAVVQGSGRAMVTATGMDTEMGSIATMLEATEEARTPLQAEVARIGRMLGIAVVIVAVVVVTTILLISDIRGPQDVVTVLLLGVSLAVAAVPEGLPAILSVVLALGVQRMAVHRAIIKDLSSVETLGSASVIASDKTGTLTRSQMTIQQVVTASGSANLTGVGYAPVGEVLHDGGRLGPGRLRTEQTIVLGGGSLANNSSLRQVGSEWQIEGDPTEAAFLVAERKLGDEGPRRARFERSGEIPFTSERKLMSTIELDHDHQGQRVLLTKGAPDVLLDLCDRLQLGHDLVELDAVRKRDVLEGVERLSHLALRTLSVAYRPLAEHEDASEAGGLERDLIFVGTVGMIDPPRPEAKVAIEQAQRAGIRVIMITGDHPGTAGRIAEDLGIVAAGARVLTGAEIDRLPGDDLAATIRAVSVYARVAPRHKLLIIAALQADGNIVAMTGDGVNDAPALKAADLGVAMGMTGTEVTKEAAKMVLADDNFATIVRAVREGRSIFDNIRKSLRYLLSSNMGEVITVFVGVVCAGVLGITGQGEAVVLPLLATQILWINLVTDSAPALAMGLDPETDDVMARSPRRLTDRVIDGRMWGGVVFLGAVMAAATLVTLDLYLPGGLIAGTRDLANARTAAFTVLVLAQLFNCFNARSETSSAFRHLFVNRWLWCAVGVSVLLQVGVVNLGFLNTAFRTEPLSLSQWAVCLAMASAVLWADELRKAVLRHRAAHVT